MFDKLPFTKLPFTLPFTFPKRFPIKEFAVTLPVTPTLLSKEASSTTLKSPLTSRL